MQWSGQRGGCVLKVAMLSSLGAMRGASLTCCRHWSHCHTLDLKGIRSRYHAWP